jgi:trans-2,3-dihydro-3-hydroxyanthranilate isomerase
MRRRFFTLDVFTGQRFAGNPLAVVLQSELLDGTTMQAIAREFNHPETVFGLEPADLSHRAKLRIFTPARELPFAGHPTIGTAVLLGILDNEGKRSMVLEEGIGAIHCDVEPLSSDRGYARFDLARLPEPLGEAPPVDTIAATLGLAPGDIGFDQFVPGKWSAGNPFVFVPLAGRDAVARSRPEMSRWDAEFGGAAPVGVFVYCRETVERGNDFHARMFAPGFGIAEDPATGSAAAAFAGVVARYGGLSDGDHTVAIEQGYEMGRPSLITLTITLRAGKVAAAAVGGEAVIVTEGEIEA